jgi:hypothetical protein
MRYGKPAKVIKPLSFIRNHCATTHITPKGERVTEYVYPYPTAQREAKRGNGAAVQRIAMQIACS